MHNLMFPWKQKSNLLSGEETELLKAEQDSFEWMFRRGETLCTKNGNDIYEIKREKNLKDTSFQVLLYHSETLICKHLRLQLHILQ